MGLLELSGQKLFQATLKALEGFYRLLLQTRAGGGALRKFHCPHSGQSRVQASLDQLQAFSILNLTHLTGAPAFYQFLDFFESVERPAQACTRKRARTGLWSDARWVISR